MNKVKLFTLPYAGSSATFCMKWAKYFLDNIELYPIEFAGRGKRFKEPFYNSINEAVDDAYNNIKNYLVDDYIIYAHSMGCLAVYELLRKIKINGDKNPLHIFLSGRFPPHVEISNPVYLLNDDDFIEEIIKYGGTSDKVLKNKDFLKIFLPILRSDYKITETYKLSTNIHESFDVDITYFYSNKDLMITKKNIEEWKLYTTKKFKIISFEGGHFFIFERYQDIINVINNTLYNYYQ